jgi:hypothetical protein
MYSTTLKNEYKKYADFFADSKPVEILGKNALSKSFRNQRKILGCFDTQI